MERTTLDKRRSMDSNGLLQRYPNHGWQVRFIGGNLKQGSPGHRTTCRETYKQRWDLHTGRIPEMHLATKVQAGRQQVPKVRTVNFPNALRNDRAGKSGNFVGKTEKKQVALRLYDTSPLHGTGRCCPSSSLHYLFCGA